MVDIRLKVRASDLVTELGDLDQPYNIGWSSERLDVGGGKFTIPHDSPGLQAVPELLAAENVVTVYDADDPSWEGFAWLIRRRNRTRGDTWDPVQVAGPGAVELLRQALVYPPHGLAGPPMDERLFAWQGYDYLLDGWGPPTSLGTYANPTDSSLKGNEGVAPVNEVQRVRLNAESPPFPWGSSYPSASLDGTFRLSHNGQTTAKIAYNASAATIKARLEALSHIDQVTVTGSPLSTFDVEFSGPNVAGKQQPLIKLQHDLLRHTHRADGVYVIRVTPGTKGVKAEGLIEGWPDDQSEWFGNYGATRHYRRVLNVPADPGKEGPAVIFVVSLGPVDVWLDGDHLGSGDNLDLLQFHAELYAIPHVLAIKAEAPTMVTVVRVDADGVFGSVLYRSFTPAVFGGPGAPDPWYAYGPDDPPGVTPGFILRTLFDDATERGYLPPVTTSITFTQDSLGRAWTQELELGVQVGNDSVLSVAERLRDLGVSVDMSPSLVFRGYRGVRRDRGATPGSGLTTVTVGLTDAHNLGIETDDEEINALLIRTVDAWVERHDHGARREGFLSLGTVPSASSAVGIADAHLADFRSPRQEIGWTTSSGQAVSKPEVAYQVGDLIVGPKLAGAGDLLTSGWTTGDVRVNTIAAIIDVKGDITWVHETSPA